MIELYPKVVIKGKDFSKAPKVTVPKQSLTLKEIIRRFIRHESLPVSHEGTYEDRMGDLEKLKHADITTRMERASELRQNIKKGEARVKASHEAELQARAAAIAKQESAAAPPPNPV